MSATLLLTFKMPTENIEATSPAAKKGDAQVKGSGNIETGQAAVLLMAQADKAKQQPARQAAEDTAPEAIAPDLTMNNPAAEAPPASEETAPAEEATPAAETTEAAPEATEEEADSVPSQTISFTPEQQKLLNKRIGKEVAKTKAIEAQKAELAAKVAELEAKIATPAAPQAPIVIAPTPNMPLGDVMDIAKLGEIQSTAKEAARYIEDVLDDTGQWQTMTDPKDEDRQIKVHKIGETLFTEVDLKRKLREARRTLEDHIPQRAQWLATKQQITQQAHARFPFLTDKQSPEYQMAEQGRRNPQYAPLMAMPNAEWILGVLVKGAKAVDAEDAAKAAPKPKPAPVVKPKPAADQTAVSASGAAARAPIGSAERQQIAAESAKLSAKGGITSDDAVGLLLKSSQLRKTR